MSLNSIKYLYFADGKQAPFINDMYRIPYTDFSGLIVYSSVFNNLTIPTSNNVEQRYSIVDINGITWEVRFTKVNSTRYKATLYINNTLMCSVDESEAKPMFDYITKFSVIFGYYNGTISMGLLFPIEYGNQLIYSSPNFLNDTCEYKYSGNIEAPFDLTYFTTIKNLYTTWKYVNSRNDAFYCDGFGNDIGNFCNHYAYAVSASAANNYLQYANSIMHDTPILPPSDPYADGGTSETGGGTGTFDGSTANVDLPSTTPSASAGASGFIKLFNPSAANLAALAAYLWGTFDITSFKSIYNNPIDCIISLMVVPVTPTTGTAATISLGNVATDVTAPVVSSQFVIKDCGSLNINEYWGAYLDYDPYTKCEIYLPYIGVHDIDINDIQGKTIQLKYYIDVLSGACVALLLCGTDVLYHWSGQCGAEVPITSTGFGSVFQTALSAANAIGETIVNAMSGIPQSISLVASSVFNGARSKVHKSGSIGSMAGHMDIQTPYLIITRPVQSVPEKLNELQGYPSNITATLSDLTGYTEVETIYLKDIPATTAEIDEIEALLKGGVII